MTDLLDSVNEHIEQTAINADLDNDPEQEFEHISSALIKIENFTNHDIVVERIEESQNEISEKISGLEELIREREEEREREQMFEEEHWDIASSSRESRPINTYITFDEHHARSVFDDIDK